MKNLPKDQSIGEIKPVTVRVKVHGIVQGVFFRSSLKHEADQFSVTGWARNMSDGSVEALLQGDEIRVKKIIDWCHLGPKNARVDSVTTTPVETDAIYQHFTILL